MKLQINLFDKLTPFEVKYNLNKFFLKFINRKIIFGFVTKSTFLGEG